MEEEWTGITIQHNEMIKSIWKSNDVQNRVEHPKQRVIETETLSLFSKEIQRIRSDNWLLKKVLSIRQNSFSALVKGTRDKENREKTKEIDTATIMF